MATCCEQKVGEEEVGRVLKVSEDQDDFTNRMCEFCGEGFDLSDPHYYDEEDAVCYCSEVCFRKEKEGVEVETIVYKPFVAEIVSEEDNIVVCCNCGEKFEDFLNSPMCDECYENLGDDKDSRMCKYMGEVFGI